MANIINILLQVEIKLPDIISEVVPALNKVLLFFSKGLMLNDLFCESKSVCDIMNGGSGASVKLLLGFLPLEKTKGKQYNLLLQMAIAAQDRDCVQILLS